MLWKKVTTGLSAGRVQSVATRLVVERERARMAFVSAGYWDIAGTLRPVALHRDAGRLSTVDASRGAATSTTAAQLKKPDGVVVLDEAAATLAVQRADGRRARGALGGGEALPALAGRAVHHLNAAAGGQPQAAHVGPDGHARRPAAVRERLHHLHAYRLDDALGDGCCSGAGPGDRALRCRPRQRQAADLGQEGQERAGGTRGDPPGG